ncbi:hypothetical protein MUN88_13015 [Gracilibacillus caseinilyticus]|uniref:Transposase n=1 Tax=Gracilibacillus caseinilyticus TaxID=2932256 RepID=A0ABY4ERE2_9BACI|nr:hypothetical protein [Gracilibacillus caseinilyticus]UOQ47005.1 hypothetical protein MUN88_13015 [Gracilibacillus caseinilyticus]
MHKLNSFIQMVQLLGSESVISFNPIRVQIVNGYEGFSSIQKANSVQAAINRFYFS